MPARQSSFSNIGKTKGNSWQKARLFYFRTEQPKE